MVQGGTGWNNPLYQPIPILPRDTTVWYKSTRFLPTFSRKQHFLYKCTKRVRVERYWSDLFVKKYFLYFCNIKKKLYLCTSIVQSLTSIGFQVVQPSVPSCSICTTLPARTGWSHLPLFVLLGLESTSYAVFCVRKPFLAPGGTSSRDVQLRQI